jgi:hypothetical protein
MAKPQKELEFDPATIGKTSDAIRQIERAIAELEDKRHVALSSPDGLSEVRQIDDRIAGLRADIAVMREREAWVAGKALEAERRQREQRRLAAVADIKTRLGAREVAAQKLDQALASLAEAFAAFERADAALFVGWPDVLPNAEMLRFLRLMNIDALSYTRKSRPPGPGAVLVLLNKLPLNLAAEAEKRNGELIAALEAEPTEKQNTAAAS